jgi:hypothetical protein
MNLLLKTTMAFGLAASSSLALAEIVEGRTEQDRRYMVGGVGVEEVERMRQHAAQFPLQLVIASKTGAYLANTEVRINSREHGTVLQKTLDAPWLLVDLPPGSYTIEASNRGRTQQRQVSIGPGARQHIVLHFDVPVDQPGTTGAVESPQLPAAPGVTRQ